MQPSNNLWILFRMLAEQIEFPQVLDKLVEMVYTNGKEKQDEE